jgi:hypothetical protein
MKRGRKPKPNALRDKSGVVRGEGYHPETIARRERELEALKIPLTYLQSVGSRVEERPTALTNLAGFTLGLLYLRWQKDPKDRFGVSEEEYNAGEKWSKLVRLHSRIMNYELKRNVNSQQWISVGRGISTAAEPDEEEILKVRARFKSCYDALVKGGWQTADLVYSVCIDNIPISQLTERHVRILRIGLGALAKEMA